MNLCSCCEVPPFGRLQRLKEWQLWASSDAGTELRPQWLEMCMSWCGRSFEHFCLSASLKCVPTGHWLDNTSCYYSSTTRLRNTLFDGGSSKVAFSLSTKEITKLTSPWQRVTQILVGKKEKIKIQSFCVSSGVPFLGHFYQLAPRDPCWQ